MKESNPLQRALHAAPQRQFSFEGLLEIQVEFGFSGRTIN